MGDEADRLVDSFYDDDDYWPSGLDFEDDDCSGFYFHIKLKNGIEGMKQGQAITEKRMLWKKKHEQI
jgi:hypothetical protein